MLAQVSTNNQENGEKFKMMNSMAPVILSEQGPDQTFTQLSKMMMNSFSNDNLKP